MTSWTLLRADLSRPGGSSNSASEVIFNHHIGRRELCIWKIIPMLGNDEFDGISSYHEMTEI